MFKVSFHSKGIESYLENVKMHSKGNLETNEIRLQITGPENCTGFNFIHRGCMGLLKTLFLNKSKKFLVEGLIFVAKIGSI